MAIAWTTARGVTQAAGTHVLLPKFTVADILRTIEGMSLVKLNVFHWHLTDAQSFPFASRRFPHLAEHGAFHPSLVYTPDDVRAVVAHAADLGVRLC